MNLVNARSTLIGSLLPAAIILLSASCSQQNIVAGPDTSAAATSPIVVAPKAATNAPAPAIVKDVPAPVADPVPYSRGDELVMITVGESAKISSAVSLDFIRVVSDSRCPAGTQCIWAGEITIELKLHSGSEEKIFTLTDHTKTTSVLGMQVELLSIDRENNASFRVKKI